MKRQPGKPEGPKVCDCGCRRAPCVMIRRAGESEADHHERIRVALDEAMLKMPAVAHLVREDPLSKKYKDGLIRPATSKARKR